MPYRHNRIHTDRQGKPMKIKTLIADNRKIVRDGLRTLLVKEPDMEVIGEAEDGRTTVQLAGTLQPDVIIVNITMPDMSVLVLIRALRLTAPHAKIAVLSLYNDKRLVSGIFEAGALAFLLKDNACRELSAAIRTIITGSVYLSPKIAETAFKKSDGPHWELHA